MWLCSNKECKKSSPDWSFEESFEPYKKEFNKLNDSLNKLSKVKVDNYNIEIKLHEVRWIGDGSGKINVKKNNSNTSVTFYFDEGKVKYLTDDAILLETLSKIDFDSRLKEMWTILMKLKSILSTNK